MLKQVTSTTDFSPRRRLTPAARALASALIFLITWGATVEAVHQHGNSRPNLTQADSILSPGKLNQTQQPLQSGECSICQLHLNLFSGLLHALPFTLPVELVLNFTLALALLHLSLTIIQRRGRAPPSVSLL